MEQFGLQELQMELFELFVPRNQVVDCPLVPVEVLFLGRVLKESEPNVVEGWWLGVTGLESCCEILENRFFGHGLSQAGVLLLNIHRVRYPSFV